MSKATENCLAGKILWVDLSNKRIWTEETMKYAQKTLGGRGINSLIMINKIPPNVKWSDPENLLCFGVGSLVGTLAPGACRVDISTINVFTGGKGSANIGGFWGPELKYAGFDNIIIVGKSDKPVYLIINNGVVEIRDASFVWGRGIYETEDILRDEIGDNHIEIAAIGPAGENRVRGSVIMVDTAAAAGGSGVGCVMGDKKLKAIVVRGRGKIRVTDKKRFMRVIDKLYHQCMNDNNMLERMRKAPYLAASNPEWESWDNALSVKNGQDDYWEKNKRIKLMNLKTGIPSMQKGVRGCYSCPTGCIPFMRVDRGKQGLIQGEGLWLNALWGNASRFDISDPKLVAESWLLINDLGLDGDYMASGLSWVFELYEKGIINKQDTDGIELKWGDGEILIKMIKKLVYREGIGDLLADGMLEASKKFGNNSDYYLIQVKGQPSIEPFRIPKGWALAVSTSPVAGRHLRGATKGSNYYGPRPRPGNFNITDYKNQAEGVVWQGKTKELEDNLGVCSFIATFSGPSFYFIDDFRELINSGLGLNVTNRELMDYYALIGRNLEKAFNAIHTNLSRKDDLPPKRFIDEEVKSGPFKGSKIDENEYGNILSKFYELWGWDKETGLQIRSNLEKIGLQDIADKLWKYGKLINK
jgi:aldehyde:ferredoxin oxidoreductase